MRGVELICRQRCGDVLENSFRRRPGRWGCFLTFKRPVSAARCSVTAMARQKILVDAESIFPSLGGEENKDDVDARSTLRSRFPRSSRHASTPNHIPLTQLFDECACRYLNAQNLRILKPQISIAHRPVQSRHSVARTRDRNIGSDGEAGHNFCRHQPCKSPSGSRIELIIVHRANLNR